MHLHIIPDLFPSFCIPSRLASPLRQALKQFSSRYQLLLSWRKDCKEVFFNPGRWKTERQHEACDKCHSDLQMEVRVPFSATPFCTAATTSCTASHLAKISDLNSSSFFWSWPVAKRSRFGFKVTYHSSCVLSALPAHFEAPISLNRSSFQLSSSFFLSFVSFPTTRLQIHHRFRHSSSCTTFTSLSKPQTTLSLPIPVCQKFENAWYLKSALFLT